MAGPWDLDALLRAQELTKEDIEANRGGRVSERQAAQVTAHRRRLTMIPLTSIAGLLSLSTGLAIYDFVNKHHPIVFILPAISVVFSVAFYAFFALVLRLPRIDGREVNAVEGPVEGLLGISNRGGYVVRIKGVRYKGVATGLKPDLKGQVVRAYVVPGLAMVVAMVPA
jgi:hypothetical protein